MPNRQVAIAVILFAGSAFSAHQVWGGPSTADFMNVMTVCGMGSTITIDANLRGSLKSLYEGETTQGKAVQEILPKIAEKLPQGDDYKRYVECLEKMLTK
ncbi:MULTISPECIES: hypothetical protein [Rhizobium]|uniref:hypothetical protein n=1 Tax=Rhizobium TaxID=379 RepID=UPI001C920EFC|nr:hypothetical protein [Rhizobium laguerreae]MBY3355150.1 hypothetical protein [Rhizobium laguerreae]MBY3454267.1 hypothetical protein [Rhizobium laguerreae]MBY3461422.1 hypothetical protein [Rhizobium laguerreae]